MSNDSDSLSTVISKIVIMASAWWGAMSLASIQATVAILSGIFVGGYALLQSIALWRREFRKPP